ncbi:MAG TPA: hypothetical protein V6D33_10605 [Cyanophyceae cyanobacterium]
MRSSDNYTRDLIGEYPYTRRHDLNEPYPETNTKLMARRKRYRETKDSSFIVSAALILGLMLGISLGSVARFIYNSAVNLDAQLSKQELIDLD